MKQRRIPCASIGLSITAGVFVLATASLAATVHYNLDSRTQSPTEAEEATTYLLTNLRTGDSNVPPNSAGDLANGITPVIISGAAHGSSAAIGVLTDGVGASSEADTAGSFFFADATAQGMFRISLTQAKAISEINTYSWHRNTENGARAPQVYDIYAADGTEANTNDPNSAGWTLIAQVDTRTMYGDMDGQYGVSIQSASGNTLGNYRDFIFVVYRTSQSQSTFFNEIDIVEGASSDAAVVHYNLDSITQSPTEAEEATTYVFTDLRTGDLAVPPNSAGDLANGRTPVLISGTAHSASAAIGVLTDGVGATSQEDLTRSFFFDDATTMGVFRISLAEAKAISEINTYSWHRNAENGARAPQVYDVYAADGTEADTNDPNSAGWTLIARVDTRTVYGNMDGQQGVSIQSASGRALGNYRDFIFAVYKPLNTLYSNTFFNEIDIVKAIPSGTIVSFH